MRLLYVVVAFVSAFTGYVALEAKPIETKTSMKAARPVLQTRGSVTRQAVYYETGAAQAPAKGFYSYRSCCSNSSACTNQACRTGKSACEGKSCGCGK